MSEDKLTPDEIRGIVEAGVKTLHEEVAPIANDTFKEIYMLGVKHMADIVNSKLHQRKIHQDLDRVIEALEGGTPASAKRLIP
jgi:hypothetical protein